VTAADIVPLAATDLDAALDLAVRAVQHDPVFVMSVPDEADRLRLVTPLVAAVLRAYLPHGGVLATRGTIEGVALCLPPGEAASDAELVAAGIGEVLALWGESRFAPVGALFAAFTTVRTRLMPMPHWYCPILAVEPARQRQGVGSAMLGHIKARATAAGMPIYLETVVPGTVDYYEGHGFRVVESHTTPELGNAPWWALRWDSPG
jgi:GNAT superfamily N-acetyltransferase